MFFSFVCSAEWAARRLHPKTAGEVRLEGQLLGAAAETKAEPSRALVARMLAGVGEALKAEEQSESRVRTRGVR
jgi:hypothetical protein